ncbi:MAG: hypothetical protein KAS12_02695, partial [Candidatus Aenigmarchaeota archaeon]|nr:hypothetical protein [Candidatus Aenigmarchaeota archaeon]
ILMVLAVLSFEMRPKTEFYNLHKTKSAIVLYKNLMNLRYVQKDARIKNIKKLTALIQPLFEGQDIFYVMGNTNLLEGDVIRFFRQILDRIGQVKNATKDDILLDKIKNCEQRIMHTMDGIDSI